MKTKFNITVVILLLCTISGFAQSDKVGDRLHKLFILCFTDNYKDASKYIVYRGRDTSRAWKDVYDYENEDERKSVIDVCNRIKNYLEEGGDYELTDFTEEEESEGVWYTWLVEFIKGNHKKVYFSFLKVGKRYALGDID
jgi:hypothetical protein